MRWLALAVAVVVLASCRSEQAAEDELTEAAVERIVAESEQASSRLAGPAADLARVAASFGPFGARYDITIPGTRDHSSLSWWLADDGFEAVIVGPVDNSTKILVYRNGHGELCESVFGRLKCRRAMLRNDDLVHPRVFFADLALNLAEQSQPLSIESIPTPAEVPVPAACFVTSAPAGHSELALFVGEWCFEHSTHVLVFHRSGTLVMRRVAVLPPYGELHSATLDE